ncbi:hypothetical protein EP47_02840 [Legionella norrlandica]|uniref:Uncharacterized protein n=2 Tax=Legionella norrlandica TaxID=1498499 RepID=A0A0A2T735_9GAMM|nr:hypothetical protein EP47_02840 [Legionella norrlandica]
MLQEKRTELLNKIQDMKSKCQSAEQVLRPFLVAEPLMTMYHCLRDVSSAVGYSHRDVMEHVAEMIKLQAELSQYLTSIHQPVIQVIEESMLELLYAIIIKLTNETSNPEEVQKDCNALGLILDSLPGEGAAKLKVQTACSLLKAQLEQRELQQKIDQELPILRQILSTKFTSIAEFLSITNPVKEKWKSFLEKAQVINVDVLIIKDALKQIEMIEVSLIKQELDNHIKQIQNNVWARLLTKKSLYFELMDKIEQVLRVLPFLQLTENEKEQYCKQLSSGFELSQDSRFLELIIKCSNSFYDEDDLVFQQIVDYVNDFKSEAQSHEKQQEKVQFNFVPGKNLELTPSDEEDLEPQAKKRRLEYLQDFEEGENESLSIQQFINLLDPVIDSGSDLSRRFAAATLQALAQCIHKIPGVSPGPVLIMTYNT